MFAITRHAVRHIFIRLVLVTILLGLLAGLGHYVGKYIPGIESWIDDQGVWGPVVYVLGFGLLASCFVSIDALSFAGGLMFGLGFGFLYAYLATFVSACLVFFVTRHLIYRRVSLFVAGHKELKKVDQATSEKGLKIMFLLRLSPLPFAPLSYALSTTKVKFRDYLLAVPGMFLTVFVSTYYGYVAKHVTALAGGQEHKSVWHYMLMLTMLVVSIVAFVVISRTVRKALRQD